jgi:hypothetical protein
MAGNRTLCEQTAWKKFMVRSKPMSAASSSNYLSQTSETNNALSGRFTSCPFSGFSKMQSSVAGAGDLRRVWKFMSNAAPKTTD